MTLVLKFPDETFFVGITPDKEVIASTDVDDAIKFETGDGARLDELQTTLLNTHGRDAVCIAVMPVKYPQWRIVA